MRGVLNKGSGMAKLLIAGEHKCGSVWIYCNGRWFQQQEVATANLLLEAVSRLENMTSNR